jgi:hypothetical protein
MCQFIERMKEGKIRNEDTEARSENKKCSKSSPKWTHDPVSTVVHVAEAELLTSYAASATRKQMSLPCSTSRIAASVQNRAQSALQERRTLGKAEHEKTLAWAATAGIGEC